MCGYKYGTRNAGWRTSGVSVAGSATVTLGYYLKSPSAFMKKRFRHGGQDKDKELATNYPNYTNSR